MKPLRLIVYAFTILVVVYFSTNVLVDTPPLASTLDSMPRLGTDADYNFSETAINAAATSGAKLFRSHVSWTTVEPANTDPTGYNWTYYDSALSRTAAAGLSPILVIDKCPTWACPFMRGPINQAKLADYTEFITALVSRYSRAPYNVRYWELFDEPDSAAGPNGQWSYGNHAAEYVEALRILYETARSSNPEAVVMNGGLAFDYPTVFRPEFLAEMLDAGAARYLDALNFHYFPVNGPGWARISDKAAEIRRILALHGAAHLPLVCTSTGESSENIAPWNSSESLQARYLVKVNVQAAATEIKATVWYLTQDFDCVASSACPAGWEVWARHGLVRQAGAPKPAHQALQVLAREVGSGAFLRPLGPETGVTGSLEGYAFGGSSEGRPPVSVVWNNQALNATMSLPALQADNFVRALDIYGRPLDVTPGAGGSLTLPVGPDPIYLEWRSPRLPDLHE